MGITGHWGLGGLFNDVQGKSDVVEVVKTVASNFDNVDAVVAKIRGEDGLSGYDYGANEDGRWTPWRVRKFCSIVCEAIGVPLPPETRRVFIAVALTPALDAFLRSEMEEMDFFAIFRALTHSDKHLINTSIDFIAVLYYRH